MRSRPGAEFAGCDWLTGIYILIWWDGTMNAFCHSARRGRQGGFAVLVRIWMCAVELEQDVRRMLRVKMRWKCQGVSWFRRSRKTAVMSDGIHERAWIEDI